MSRLIKSEKYDGAAIAVLVESEKGNFLSPPIVADEQGHLVMGHNALAAAVESGVTLKEYPAIYGCTPGQLANLEQDLAAICDELGVKLIG